MNRTLILGFALLAFVSCKPKWEYKVVSVKPSDATKFQPNRFFISETTLNTYGKDGWELVDVYEQTETVHPNFGNDQYVTGLQPNIRTLELGLLFKREVK